MEKIEHFGLEYAPHVGTDCPCDPRQMVTVLTMELETIGYYAGELDWDLPDSHPNRIIGWRIPDHPYPLRDEGQQHD